MIVLKSCKNVTDAPRVEVGEIDTRAPFQSVKDAVTLFGEGTSLSGKSTLQSLKASESEQKVFAKECELHLARKEISKLKEQLKNAETRKFQLLFDLENAKRIVENLNEKLKNKDDYKISTIIAIKVAEDLVTKFTEANANDDPPGNALIWKQELKTAKEQYTASISELDTAKMELRKFHEDIKITVDAKDAAFLHVAEAERVTKGDIERAAKLSEDISTIKKSLLQVNLTIDQVQYHLARILVEKDLLRIYSDYQLEEIRTKLAFVKKDFVPNLVRNLEEKIFKISPKIALLQTKVEKEKSRLAARNVIRELRDAKEVLHEVIDEEISLTILMTSLESELESVKNECSELRKEKELESASFSRNLHLKLPQSKGELETAETEAIRASLQQMIIQQSLSASENVKEDEDVMKQNSLEIKEKCMAIKIILKETERRLHVALKEAEEIKAKAFAVGHIKILSDKKNSDCISTSKQDAKITISREEFERLNRNIEESNTLAELKVASAMAQLEIIKASENEAMKRLEVSYNEIDEMEKATLEALNMAEIEEATKRAVKAKLRKWQGIEKNEMAETVNITSETESPLEISSQSDFPEQLDGKHMTDFFPGSKMPPPYLDLTLNKEESPSCETSSHYLPWEKPENKNTWKGWERHEIYACIAITGAAVSVAIAYAMYKKLH